MSYNHYRFMLDHYRQRSDGLFASDPGIVAVRKAIHNSHQHEAARMKERYRHEMARKRREQLENERLIKIRISELKRKEREICNRYDWVRMRVTNGETVKHGPEPSKLRTRPTGMEKLSHSLQYSSAEPKRELEAYRVARTKGKERILVFPSVDSIAQPDGNATFDSRQPEGIQVKRSKNYSKPHLLPALGAGAAKELGQGLQVQEYSNDLLSPKERSVGNTLNLSNRQDLNGSRATLPISNDLLPDVYGHYRYKGGFGMRSDFIRWQAKRDSGYEMLVLDGLDHPRAEQIRVDQMHPSDPRCTYDILALEERATSPGNSDSLRALTNSQGSSRVLSS